MPGLRLNQDNTKYYTISSDIYSLHSTLPSNLGFKTFNELLIVRAHYDKSNLHILVCAILKGQIRVAKKLYPKIKK